MKPRSTIISTVPVFVLIIAIAAYAHSPARGPRRGYGMGESVYKLTGGHEMMSGYGSGHRMMGEYGYNENEYNHDVWDQNRQNSRNYRQNDSNFRARAQLLINEIEEKRKELSFLLRSDNADKVIIDKKIEEFNRLERYLDEILP